MDEAESLTVPEVEYPEEDEALFPACPKCGRPIINGLYCINCGAFIKELPEKASNPSSRSRRRRT